MHKPVFVTRNGNVSPNDFDFTKLEYPNGVRIQYPNGSIGDADPSAMGTVPIPNVSAVALNGRTLYLGTPGPNGLFIFHKPEDIGFADDTE